MQVQKNAKIFSDCSYHLLKLIHHSMIPEKTNARIPVLLSAKSTKMPFKAACHHLSKTPKIKPHSTPEDLGNVLLHPDCLLHLDWITVILWRSTSTRSTDTATGPKCNKQEISTWGNRTTSVTPFSQNFILPQFKNCSLHISLQTPMCLRLARWKKNPKFYSTYYFLETINIRYSENRRCHLKKKPSVFMHMCIS